MAHLFGKDAVLYYSSVAIGVTPATNTAADLTWVAQANVRDLTGNFTATKTDVTTRATAALGWEAEAVVLNKGELTFEIPELDVADTTLDAMKAAWLAQSTICLMSLNQPIATDGAEGLAANWSLEMTKNEPLRGPITWNITATVDNTPEWYTVVIP